MARALPDCLDESLVVVGGGGAETVRGSEGGIVAENADSRQVREWPAVELLLKC